MVIVRDVESVGAVLVVAREARAVASVEVPEARLLVERVGRDQRDVRAGPSARRGRVLEGELHECAAVAGATAARVEVGDGGGERALCGVLAGTREQGVEVLLEQGSTGAAATMG
jgi:hypothetical protein